VVKVRAWLDTIIEPIITKIRGVIFIHLFCILLLPPQAPWAENICEEEVSEWFRSGRWCPWYTQFFSRRIGDYDVEDVTFVHLASTTRWVSLVTAEERPPPPHSGRSGTSGSGGSGGSGSSVCSVICVSSDGSVSSGGSSEDDFEEAGMGLRESVWTEKPRGGRRRASTKKKG
jgi:uncharacterized membrane protein YgcG